MKNDHIKNFDGWNEKKKRIDVGVKRRFYRVREVWWCALGVNVGFEENGTGIEYQRPVLVLRGLSRETCLVAPLTTSQNFHKYRIPIGIVDGRPAQAILSQVRVVDAKRLVNRIAILDKEIFQKIRKSAIDIL